MVGVGVLISVVLYIEISPVEINKINASIEGEESEHCNMLPITNVDKLPTPEGCICLSNYSNTKIDVNLMHGNFIADFRNLNLKSILVDLTDI